MSDRYDPPMIGGCITPVEVRQDGSVRAGGVMLGKLVSLPGGGTALQVKDRDNRRCEQRGDTCILVDLKSLGELAENKSPGE
jgi:hypothetical protein